MRVLVIPDVHLKPWMFFPDADRILASEADMAVCLGDIVDNFECENNAKLYRQTLSAANEFTVKHPETLWCKGNHDMSYLWDVPCSGTTRNLDVQDIAIEGLCSLYERSNAAIVHRIDDVIFFHAGISRAFARGLATGSLQYDDTDAVIERINSLGMNGLWNMNSPIWLRPQKEYAESTPDMYMPRKFLQIVGHSPMKEIVQEGSTISCDTFSTYRNGMPIGDESFCIIDTVTRKWERVASSRRNTFRMWSLILGQQPPEWQMQ